MTDNVFDHECVAPDCKRRVELDDEPWCYEHSPDEGSALVGYSARHAAKLRENADLISRNIFENSPSGKSQEN